MRTIMVVFLFVTTYVTTVQVPPKANLKQQEKNDMDTNKLTNEVVKSAFDAWQKSDRETFLSFFNPDTKLYDDGNPRDFQSFVAHACGSERFTSIDKVENEGMDIFGHFHTEQWGDFNTYFKFHFGENGKFDKLDIGQANY